MLDCVVVNVIEEYAKNIELIQKYAKSLLNTLNSLLTRLVNGPCPLRKKSHEILIRHYVDRM
jgi:hypothetical protein